MSVRISVVIPTRDRVALLQRCLEALRLQDYDPELFEIIVADDAAHPVTAGCVENERRKHPLPEIRYLPVEGPHGPAAARNRGWRAARGSVIAFTDDDCLPQEHWLSAGASVFFDGIVAASGRIIVPTGPRPTDYEHDTAGLESAEFATANCFYRRKVLEEFGGFDERFATAWREDADLFFTLVENGKSIAYVPDAVVVHPVRPAPWGISVRLQKKTLYNALLFKKHPVLYRERIQPGPLWNYYIIDAALGAALLLFYAGQATAALAALALWLAFSAGFCLRRLHNTSHAIRHIFEMIVTSLAIPPVSTFWRIAGSLKFRVFYF